MELAANFLGDTQEWLRDEHERDDEAYRNEVAELIIRFANPDKKWVYDFVDWIWEEFDPASIFTVTQSTSFIESLSSRELQNAQESVTSVAHILRHGLHLTGMGDRRSSTIAVVTLMGGFLGNWIAKSVIKVNRDFPNIPFPQTISAFENFLRGVQSADIVEKNGSHIVFNDRVRGEWETTKKHLSQLWTSAEI